LKELRGDMHSEKLQEFTTYQEYDPKTFTYKKLMIKLAFEKMIADLENN
jgi:hypothetical protein